MSSRTASPAVVLPRVPPPARPRPRRHTEAGQVPLLVDRPLADCRPSPEHDRLYRPIDPADPDIAALAESIKTRGLKERIVVSEDGYIISGHRRRAAAVLAGLKAVPVRVEPIRRAD